MRWPLTPWQLIPHHLGFGMYPGPNYHLLVADDLVELPLLVGCHGEYLHLLVHGFVEPHSSAVVDSGGLLLGGLVDLLHWLVDLELLLEFHGPLGLLV